MTEKIALNKFQIKDLLETIKEENKKHSLRNWRIAKVWLNTGFRVSELCNFKLDWLREQGDLHLIRVKKNKKPFSFSPKYDSVRSIPINKEIYKIIKTQTRGRNTGYVFKPQSSKTYARFHPNYIIGLFNNYFVKTESIGRKLGTHTFRRTFASQLDNTEPSIPITKISEYLGHKQISTTTRYLRSIKNDDHSAIKNSKFFKQDYT